MNEAKGMSADALEDKLRDFGHWWKNRCENLSQTVEAKIYDALDDEANAIGEARRDGTPPQQ